MRPEIPESVEQRINDIYAEAGYASGTELVRDAVRRWVEQLEQKYPEQDTSDYPDFEYSVSSNTELIRLTLTPTDESDLRIGDRGGQHESKPTLYTEDTMIKNGTVKSALEGIDGVKRGTLTHTGEIDVQIPIDEQREFDTIVDDVFQKIADVIREKENPSIQVEKAVAKYADEQDSS